MIVDYAVYEGGHRVPDRVALDDLQERCRIGRGFAWIGLYEPTAEEFEAVTREFGLHKLAVDDAINAHQRPKLERYGDTLFVVLKTARWDAEADDVRFGEVLVFLGDDFIISVRHGGDGLHDVRENLELQPDLLEAGPSAALHAIVDSIVDGYEPVVESLDASIAGIERDVFSGSRRNPAERIFARKRDVLELYGGIVPLLEPVEILARAGFPQINPVDEAVLPGRARPPAARVRARPAAARGADERPHGEPDAGEHPPERGRPQDLRLGGDHRRPDADHRGLRHELRPHAGARLVVRLSGCARPDGDDLRPALLALQDERLALTKPIRSYIASKVGAAAAEAFSAPMASIRSSSGSSERSAR